MNVENLMTRNVVTIRPDSSVADAAALMAVREVGSVVVCRDDKAVGVITDRDIAVRVVAQGRDPKETPVGAVMTERLVTCLLGAPLWAAQELMEGNGVRRLIVIDDAGSIRGVLSSDDLAMAPAAELARPEPRLVEALM